MGRYLRLYGYFLRFSFSKALQFRLDFYFRVGMDAIWYGVNLAFFGVLFQHTGALGGWNYDQVLVFICGVFLSDALHMTVFANNMWWFPFLVNHGDLDYYLVRPVSSLFFLSVRDFAANSFLNLLLAVGILVWAIARYPQPFDAASLVVYVALLLVGVFLHYVLSLLFLIPVFWLHSAHGLREIYFSFDRFTSRPHGIYRGWMGRVLTSILPFALIVSYPTSVLFDGVTWQVVVHVLAATLGVFLFMLWLWRRGLRAYASASS